LQWRVAKVVGRLKKKAALNVIQLGLSLRKQGDHFTAGGSVNREGQDSLSQRMFHRIPPSFRFENEQPGRAINFGSAIVPAIQNLIQPLGEPSDKIWPSLPNIMKEIKEISSD
jgi:hypothetical protein